MEWSILINEIFQVCLIPLLGVLTTFLIKYIHIKSEETITKSVIATNQTYVEELKKQGHFDIEAQQLAFQKALLIVQKNLSSEARRYLTEFYGDLNAYIASSIEAAVNENK